MDKKEINRLGKQDKGHRNERCSFAFGEREKAFYEKWKEENKRNPHINFGYGILQDLMMEGNSTNVFKPAYAVTIITKRDRFIVATVMQWLGSNVGWCFLEETLKKCGYRIVKEAVLSTQKENCT